jgi:hypothetical protein
MKSVHRPPEPNTGFENLLARDVGTTVALLLTFAGTLPKSGGIAAGLDFPAKP